MPPKKPNPVDAAVGGLSELADAALRQKLMKAKGLIQEVIDGEKKEDAAEGEMSDADMAELESSLGE